MRVSRDESVEKLLEDDTSVSASSSSCLSSLNSPLLADEVLIRCRVVGFFFFAPSFLLCRHVRRREEVVVGIAGNGGVIDFVMRRLVADLGNDVPLVFFLPLEFR